MCTAVYVDGFNVYYGLFGKARQVREPPVLYRWLDIEALVRHVWPSPTADRHCFGYFTALVKATTAHPTIPVRQQTYLRALASARRCDVQLGTVQVSVPFRGARAARRHAGIAEQHHRALADGFLGKYDEKGSDVNLASFLVRDAALRSLLRRRRHSRTTATLVKPLEIAIGDFGKNA